MQDLLKVRTFLVVTGTSYKSYYKTIQITTSFMFDNCLIRCEPWLRSRHLSRVGKSPRGWVYSIIGQKRLLD